MPAERLRSIVPMFGGATRYVETLDAVLAFIESHQPTPDFILDGPPTPSRVCKLQVQAAVLTVSCLPTTTALMTSPAKPVYAASLFR